MHPKMASMSQWVCEWEHVDTESARFGMIRVIKKWETFVFLVDFNKQELYSQMIHLRYISFWLIFMEHVEGHEF